MCSPSDHEAAIRVTEIRTEWFDSIVPSSLVKVNWQVVHWYAQSPWLPLTRILGEAGAAVPEVREAAPDTGEHPEESEALPPDRPGGELRV